MMNQQKLEALTLGFLRSVSILISLALVTIRIEKWAVYWLSLACIFLFSKFVNSSCITLYFEVEVNCENLR